MQVQVYVAFSISSTNTFIRANKNIDFPNRPNVGSNITVDGISFKVSSSRDGSSRNNGLKLVTTKLDNAYHNRKPAEALNFFQDLKSKGWNVIDENKFVKKHNLTNTVPVPVSTSVEQVIPCPVPEPAPIVASTSNSEIAVSEAVVPPVISPEPVINMNPMPVQSAPYVKTSANEFGKSYKPGTRQVAIMEFMKTTPPMNLADLHKTFKANAGKNISLSDFRDSINGLVKFGMVKEMNEEFILA